MLAIRDKAARAALVASCMVAGCVTVGRLSEREAVLYARTTSAA